MLCDDPEGGMGVEGGSGGGGIYVYLIHVPERHKLTARCKAIIFWFLNRV